MNNMEPSRLLLAKADCGNAEERIEFEAILANHMRLNLDLFDLGEEGLKKTIQGKLILAKKFSNDQLDLAVSEVLQDAIRGSFDEQKFIADEEGLASARRAEVSSELKVLENRIREVVGF
ncbi:hypothetical protein ACHAPC_009974 [Botrytis cinerea]